MRQKGDPSVKTLCFPTFRRIFEALRAECRNSTTNIIYKAVIEYIIEINLGSSNKQSAAAVDSGWRRWRPPEGLQLSMEKYFTKMFGATALFEHLVADFKELGF